MRWFLVLLFFNSGISAWAEFDPTKASLKALERKLELAKDQKNCVNFELPDPEVKDQIDGTCYSYAASMIFDQLYQKENPGSHDTSSGLATAIRQAQSISSEALYKKAKAGNQAHDGGLICDIFNQQYRNQEICSFANIEQSILTKYGYDYLNYTKNLLDTYGVYKISPYLNAFFQQTKGFSDITDQGLEHFRSTLGIQLIGGKVYYRGQEASSYAQEQVSNDITCSENKNQEELFRVATKALEQAQPKDYLATLVASKCKQKLKLETDYTCEPNYSSNKEDFQQKLFQYYSDKNLRETPLGVNYCMGFLEQGKKYIPGKSECGPHANVITGTRWNAKTKTCQVRLINSYGKNGCANLANDGSFECKDGKIWVDEKKLFRAKTDKTLTLSAVKKTKVNP